MSSEYDLKQTISTMISSVEEVNFQSHNKKLIRDALNDLEREEIRIMRIIDWLRSELDKDDNDDHDDVDNG